MKAYKVEILVIDFDGLGSQGISDTFITARYPNHCMHPDIKSIEEYDIGEWDDDHPLNLNATSDDYYTKMTAINHDQAIKDTLTQRN